MTNEEYREPIKLPQCSHCRRRTSRPGYRGLCRPCYSDIAVRNLYPSQQGTGGGRQGVGLVTDARGNEVAVYGLPLPVEPTGAPPGSDAKMLVMQERIARGEHLHHPGDAGQDERRRYAALRTRQRTGRTTGDGRLKSLLYRKGI